MDGHSLLIALVLLAGSGLFLRLVAREKRRREKHLEYRLIENLRSQEERQRQAEWDKQREAKVIAAGGASKDTPPADKPS